MRLKPSNLAFLLVPLSTLGGCTVGPNYQPPKVTIVNANGTPLNPEQLHQAQQQQQAQATPAAMPSTSPTTQHSVVATDDQPVARWWTTLRDPELTRLVDRACAQNLDLQLAASRILESRSQLRLAGANLLPSVSGSGNYARIDTGKNSSLQTGQSNSGNSSNVISGINQDLFAAGLDATWELDIFGGQRRSLEAAAAEYDTQLEDRRDRLVSVTAEVGRDYLMLRGLQRRLQISQDNLKLQDETYALTQSLRHAGFNSELDVKRADTQVHQTQADAVPLQTQIIQTEHAIATLIGQEPRALVDELSPEAPLPTVPPVVEVGVPTDLLRRRPDIRRAERQIAAANARIGVALADYYPKFSVTGDFGFDASKFKGLFDWESRYLLVNPSVSWKLFDFGRTADRVAAAREERTQADISYRQAILTALRETDDAYVAFANEQNHRDALAAAAGSAREAVNISRDQYKQGLIDFLQVLDAQRQLLTTEDELAQSDEAIATNLVALYKAIGGGWETDGAKPRLD